jgi:hypothetical protein
LAKTTKWSARALAGKPRDSRNGGDAKKRPRKLACPNFVIATRERLAMKKIKVHSLTGRITSRAHATNLPSRQAESRGRGVDKVSIQMFAANLEETSRR